MMKLTFPLIVFSVASKISDKMDVFSGAKSKVTEGERRLMADRTDVEGIISVYSMRIYVGPQPSGVRAWIKRQMALSDGNRNSFCTCCSQLTSGRALCSID